MPILLTVCNNISMKNMIKLVKLNQTAIHRGGLARRSTGPGQVCPWEGTLFLYRVIYYLEGIEFCGY